MRVHPSAAIARPAHTLVEVLVVIFIISMLVGLTFVMITPAHRFVDDLEKQVAKVHQTPMFNKVLPGQGPQVTDRHIVVFQDSVPDPKAETERIAQKGLVDIQVVMTYSTLLKGAVVKTTEAGLAALKNDSAVLHIDKEYIRYPVAQVTPTGVKRMNLKAGLSGGGTGSGGSKFQGSPGIINLVPIGGPGKNTTAVTIAIFDTGVDNTHPDLIGQVMVNKAFGQPDPFPFTGTGGDHGTHVAGIAAAQNNSLGMLGAAPGARIWNYRVLGPGGGADADIIAGLNDVALFASEVQVVNMSLGGAGVSATLNGAVDRLVDLGVVVCVAAGNDTADSAGYSPASAKKAITVAALCDTDGKPGGLGKVSMGGDKDDVFADFSNYGAVVDVISPGVDIYSTVPGGYDFKSGTSMACPYVAGLVALIRAPKQTQSGPSPGTIINLNPITGKPLFPGAPKASPLPLTPAQVEKTILDNVFEYVPGLSTNNDASRKYPLVNGSFL